MVIEIFSLRDAGPSGELLVLLAQENRDWRNAQSLFTALAWMCHTSYSSHFIDQKLPKATCKNKTGNRIKLIIREMREGTDSIS